MPKRAIAAIVAALMSACASSPSGGTTPATAMQSAFVRFANVSPDAGVPAPANPQAELQLFTSTSGQIVVDGNVIASLAADSALQNANSALPALVTITPYLPLSTVSHELTVQDPSTFTGSSYLGISGTLPALKAGGYYTVVLNGSYCQHTLALTTFEDSAQGNGALVVYAVAPDRGAPSFDFGSFPASSSSGPFTKLGTAIAGTRATASVSATSNIGAYVSIGGAPQTILPNALDAYDATNALPFNALTSLALFIRDGLNLAQPGSCPFVPAPPIVQGALTN